MAKKLLKHPISAKDPAKRRRIRRILSEPDPSLRYIKLVEAVDAGKVTRSEAIRVLDNPLYDQSHYPPADRVATREHLELMLGLFSVHLDRLEKRLKRVEGKVSSPARKRRGTLRGEARDRGRLARAARP